MDRHPAGCDPEAFRRLPTPPSRLSIPRIPTPVPIPRAPSYRIPRPAHAPRPVVRFSSSVEDAIIAVCRVAPRIRSGHSAVVEFRNRSAELENRFIAHVVAELRASKAHIRSREEPRKRRRSFDSDFHSELQQHSAQGFPRKQRRASVGGTTRTSSTERPRRKNAYGLRKEMVGEEGVEAEPNRARFPRRSKHVVNLDDDYMDEEFAPEVLDGIKESKERHLSRREPSGTARGQSAADIHDVEDGDSTSGADDSDTDGEEQVLFPVVRPKMVVRERTLCSDHMSLTPVIADDDEGTDTEERRKALARRPIRTRTRPDVESQSVFGVVPRDGHRLFFDQMILLPGPDGSIVVPQPQPAGILKPSQGSQILMHPLPNLSECPVTPKRADVRYRRIEPRPVQEWTQRIPAKLSTAVPVTTGQLPLKKKTPRKLQDAHSKKSNTIGRDERGFDHANVLKYRGVSPSSAPESSAIPGGTATARRSDKLTSSAAIRNQNPTDAPKRDSPRTNPRPVAASIHHRPVSRATKPQAMQARPAQSQSLLAWKSQPQTREAPARASQSQSLLAWKPQPSSNQVKSLPSTVSPIRAIPPARIRSPEAPSSCIPDPSSVVGSTPGTSTRSTGAPASSPNTGSESKNSGSSDVFPAKAEGAESRGNRVPSHAGEVKSTVAGHPEDPNASHSASSVRPQRIGEAVVTDGVSAVGGGIDRNVAALRNGGNVSPLSAGTTDVINIASASMGIMNDEEERQSTGNFAQRGLHPMAEKTTINQLNRVSHLDQWNSAVVLPGASMPALHASVGPRNSEAVVGNSGIVPHGLAYPQIHSQLSSSVYGVPPHYSGPSAPSTGMPARVMGMPMPAEMGGRIPVPYGGALMNGSTHGNANAGMVPYPGIPSGSVVMHPYAMTPELAAAMMRGANSSQLPVPEESRDGKMIPQVPAHHVQDFNDAYKRAYMEFEKQRQKNGTVGLEEDGGGTRR